MRRLSLLFPPSDRATSDYCSRLQRSYDVDPQLVRCSHLETDDRQIERFVYWHDRLVVLKQLFDEATPRKLSQWWHDRRNGVQWYTFWVAIVVLAFTRLFGFIGAALLICAFAGSLKIYAFLVQHVVIRKEREKTGYHSLTA